jgi:uracil-DNA glycosylase
MNEWFEEKDYSNLNKIINTERKKYEVYPADQHIYRCFNYFSPEKTRVVILGQDPYHGPNQATGLSFGVNMQKSLPPSLRNIAKELKGDLGIDLCDPTLENWAKQGVLLLNSSLSVIQGKPGSHMKHYNSFITHILSILEKQNDIIFVAWGKHAYEKLMGMVEINSTHHLLVSSHPSPLSANRTFRQFPSFMGSKPFSNINLLLDKLNTDPICW